jgi:hypothetical protein
MASVSDEVKGVLLDFAPIRRTATDAVSLRDPDTGLGYSDYGLSALAVQLNQIVSRNRGSPSIAPNDVKKCKAVADVRRLVESRIP